jgi:choline kinase
MKVIILAAGMGTRLDATEGHLPKCLTQLSNGISLLQYQVLHLNQMGLQDITAVVGYQKEAIMHRFPSLTFVVNSKFAQENTAKSLLRGLLPIDDDVLWLNGDVLFYPRILSRLLQLNRTSLLVNETSVGEEEVKYHANVDGLILHISKQLKEAQGEALGINFFKRADVPLLKKHLEECLAHDYFEKAIEMAIAQGLNVWKVSVDANECIEIDFPQDLERANALLKNWSVKQEWHDGKHF